MCSLIYDENLLVLKAEYSRITWLMPWLLMPWLPVLPDHLQPLYWICRINGTLASIRKGFNYLCHLTIEKLLKMERYPLLLNSFWPGYATWWHKTGSTLAQVKKLKACTTDSPEYELNQYNLKIYNGYLRQCIRAAKKQHYTHEFAKYKNDIRKTWDTLKDIMNKKKSKVEFPTYFLNNGKYVCGAKNIADKFNEYFTEIGPSLASEIDVSNKSPFNTYLTSPCTSSFYYQYTNSSGILKIIQGLKPKTSAGYDHLSSKVLKDIADVVSIPLSIIINQSLCSGIFPS